MFKLAFLFLLCSIFARNVYSLNCYVSDRNSIFTSGTIHHEKQDCTSAISAIMPIGGGIPAGMQLRCFTVNLAGKVNVQVKGCIPKGGCDTMKEIFKLQFAGYLVNCEECKEDYCNGSQEGTVDDNTIGDR